MIIYKITDKRNGKIYVGQDSLDRPGYFGSGIIISKLVLKYGTDNFHKETLEKCDSIISLPMRGQKESLNVSVAAGIAMYELLN